MMQGPCPRKFVFPYSKPAAEPVQSTSSALACSAFAEAACSQMARGTSLGRKVYSQNRAFRRSALQLGHEPRLR